MKFKIFVTKILKYNTAGRGAKNRTPLAVELGAAKINYSLQGWGK
jgi:hypothetical protein